MNPLDELATPRLLLCRMRAEDLDDPTRMHLDPRVRSKTTQLTQDGTGSCVKTEQSPSEAETNREDERGIVEIDLSLNPIN